MQKNLATFENAMRVAAQRLSESERDQAVRKVEGRYQVEDYDPARKYGPIVALHTTGEGLGA